MTQINFSEAQLHYLSSYDNSSDDIMSNRRAQFGIDNSRKQCKSPEEVQIDEHVLNHEQQFSEEDWIQVEDSFDTISSLDRLSLITLDNQSSFELTTNGSFLFQKLPGTVKREQQGRLEILTVLGKGRFGEVYKARDTESGEFHAVKKIAVDDRTSRHHFVNEIQSLKHCLENQNIINYLDVFSYSNECAVGLVLELMDIGSLQDLLHRTTGIPWNTDESILAYISRECLRGLEFLHGRQLIHRDIKTSNILINSQAQIKLSDLGLCRRMETSINKALTFCGTLQYMSPERRIGESYGQSSDIFSLGLTILFTATGKRNEERSYWDGFKEDKFPSAEYCSDHFQSFLSSCMDTNPQRRHSANVLLGNSFLKHAELGTDKFMEVLLDQRDGDASHQYVVKST